MSLVKHTKIEILKMNAAIDNEIINQVVVDSMNFDLPEYYSIYLCRSNSGKFTNGYFQNMRK